MIWLIGAGNMSADYAKVLSAQGHEFIVIGRGETSASKFKSITGVGVILGGLDNFLSSAPMQPKAAIVSVGVNDLAATTTKLLKYGVKKILVEKPAGLNTIEISHLSALAQSLEGDVFVGYNRRFFSSVLEAEKIIRADGGVVSFHFEITERSKIIADIKKSAEIKANWFFANTTHIVDLAFFLGGKPKTISTITAGANDWHPSASIFSGSGLSESGAVFSYHGNWNLPGNWSLTVHTSSHVLIFNPLEKISIKSTDEENEVKLDMNDEFDRMFKPGVYLQVRHFIDGDYKRLCSIQEQSKASHCYAKMANYKKSAGT